MKYSSGKTKITLCKRLDSLNTILDAGIPKAARFSPVSFFT